MNQLQETENGATNLLPVGVGDLIVSSDPSAVIITYSLGSCIGLCAYDPVLRIAGLLHSQLPLSQQNPEEADRWPARYTDRGTMKLLETMYEKGAKPGNLLIKAVGGASIMDDEGHFRIGERNQAVLRKILWKNSLILAASDLGGTVSRTVAIAVRDGTVSLRIQGVRSVL